jgi:HEAT repeat protein
MILVYSFKGYTAVLALNIAIITLCGAMFFILLKSTRLYTEMCEHNLSHKNNLGTRLNAVEILGQKGHRSFPSSLQKILKRPKEPMILKESILQTIANQEDLNSVETLLELLSDPKERLRFGSAKALQAFSALNASDRRNAFTYYRVLHAMEDRLFKEKDIGIREMLVSTLFRMDSKRFIELVLHAIKVKEGTHKAMLIQMLRLFKDPNLKHYLLPNLEDKNPEVRGASLIALWPYKELQFTLEHHLKQLVDSPKRANVLMGIHVAGEVRYLDAKDRLDQFVHSTDEELQKMALLALAKMEDLTIVPDLVKLFLDPSHEWFEEMNAILSRLPERFEQIVRQNLNETIADKIHLILKPKIGKKMHEFERDTLKILHLLYTKIAAHHEAHQIQKALDSKANESL